MIRVNPKYSNTCSVRIGMYRQEQCTAGPHLCPHLSECDQHYDGDTGTWDYTHPLEIRQHVPKKCKIKNKRARAHRQKSKVEEGHRSYLVKIGKASRIPIRTNLNEASIKAGLT